MGQKRMAGLIKRGEVWHVDKQISGRRIQCSTETTDLSRAQEFLVHLLEKERRVRVYGDEVAHSFVEACARYVEEITKKSRDRDVQDLKGVMPFIGHLALKQVHFGTLQPFIDKRKADGVKSATVNRCLSVVRLVLKRAASIWRDDHGNPWLASVPEIPKLDWNDARRAYPISVMEQSVLMRHLNEDHKLMALWLLHTGLRSQELLNLNWAWRRDIPELGCFVFDIPAEFTKNKSARVMVLNRVVRDSFQRLPTQRTGYVFANAKGAKRDRILTSNWKTARQRAADEIEVLTGAPASWGFRHLRVHDLRHTFATRLRRQGVCLEVRKDLLAHVHTDVTTLYSAGELAELLDAVERLTDGVSFTPSEPDRRGKVLQFPYIRSAQKVGGVT